MEYRFNMGGRKWLATLLLIAVTSSVIPLHTVSAEETSSEDASSSSEETSSTESSASDEDVTDADSEESDTSTQTESDDDTETSDSSESVKDELVTEGSSAETAEEGVDNPITDNAPADAADVSEGPQTTEVITETPSASAVMPTEVTAEPEGNNAAPSEDETSGTSTPDSSEVGKLVTEEESPSAATSSLDVETEVTNTTDNSQTESDSAVSDSDSSRSDDDSVSELGGSTGTTTAASAIITTSTSTNAVEGELGIETSTSSEPVVIESGQAVALANIINIVNTTFVNSEGVVFFSNFLEAVNQSIDLRWLYEALAGFGCSLTNCISSDTTVNTSDSATIDNQLFLQAISGGNTIAGAESGVISTGDAYAGLNLINVANMNFIDSNYLLVTLNAFNDVNGDLVFPSADAFLSNLAGSPSSASMNTSNLADITNSVAIDADSGGNTLETAQGGSITTGSSGATTNVFNQINSSFLGGQNITILFRIHGDWVGEVFGAPDDLLWQQGPDGSVFVFDSDTGSRSNDGAHTVATNNTATINNNVQVVALTGENKITGTETGIISAGNAYAGANIVNLANGTVVGRNWILAIVNIFGDFKGNIAFGRPDLWVGEIIDAPKKVRDGSKLTYKFSVINNGDSVASNVLLTDTFDSRYLKIIDSSVPYTLNDAGELRFALGTLASGKAAEVTYTAEVVGVGNKSRELTNVVTVRSRETDNNLSDNTDTATIKTAAKSSNSGVTKVGARKQKTIIKPGDSLASELAVDASTMSVTRKTAAANVTAESPTLQQFITLTNNGNKIIPAVQYIDVLKDPFGNIIQQETWDLGNVLPGEEIELGYVITFQSSAPSGEYAFTSVVKSGVYEQTYANGTLTYTAGMLPYFTENYIPLPWGQVLSAMSSPQFFVLEGRKPWNLSLWFEDSNLLLPLMTAHSVSTVTQQQNTDLETLAMWLNQLYGYINTFISKIAPATNT